MKNVLIVKASGGKGYFLTIGDNDIFHRWAVSALELLTLLKILKDNEIDLKNEIDEIKEEEGI